MSVLHIDFETRSTLELPKVGSHLYALHPTTDVWCMAWAFDDEPTVLWENLELVGEPAQPFPARVIEHVRRGGQVAGFAVQFEWHVWNKVLRRYWPDLPKLRYQQLDCAMARAVVMGLPRSLEMSAYAINQAFRRTNKQGNGEMQKDVAGRRLMLQMSKPRFKGPNGVTWWDDRERRDRLGAYCMRDVDVERWVGDHTRPLTPRHRELWEMDFRLNHVRGIQVDTELVRQCRAVILEANNDAGARILAITGGKVTQWTGLPQIRTWMASRGHPVTSLDKDSVIQLLASEIPDDVREVLEIRQLYGKTSVAKIPSFLRRTGEDDRMHGMLLFNGAGPGRWTGQGAQLHNLPRPDFPKSDVAWMIHLLRRTDLTPREKVNILDMAFGSAVLCVADAIRGFLVAKPGHRLHVRDFANIEGRCIARIAGEQWKLDAFAAFDAGLGPDLYRVAAAGILGCTVDEVDDLMRQIGKTAELALGFQGGAEALDKMAKKYGIDLLNFRSVVYGSVDRKIISRAEWGWDTYGYRTGMERQRWLVAEIIKLAWRGRHPAIVALWEGLNKAALLAVEFPGTIQRYADIAYQFGKIRGIDYLICKLPSGRLLYYPRAKLRYKETEWGESQAYVSFQGVHPITGRWDSFAGYGGLWAENVTQGDAFDFIADAMLRCEENGFPPVLSIHDENLAEAPDTADDDLFGQLMSQRPTWAPNMPLAVDGFVGTRFRK